MSKTKVSRLVEVTVCDWCGGEIDTAFESLLYNKVQRLHFCKDKCYKAHLDKKENDEQYRRLLYLEVL